MLIVFYLLFSISSQLSESIIKFSSDEKTLEGTLLRTANSKKVVLIISGSGPTDRDGNSQLGLTNNSLKMIADSLARNGYSSFRYDKRGVGGSKDAFISEDVLTFNQLVRDANAAIDHLTENEKFKEVVVLGHSQGSLIGMLAAQKSKVVTGFISIAGAGTPADELIVNQVSVQAPVLVDELKSKLDSLKQGHEINQINPFLQALLRPSIHNFLRSYISYDPTMEISKLQLPALIINGTTDLQIAPSHAKRLSSASSGELRIIENMNHVLKESSSDPTENIATYNEPSKELHPELMPPLYNFLKGLK